MSKKTNNGVSNYDLAFLAMVAFAMIIAALIMTVQKQEIRELHGLLEKSTNNFASLVEVSNKCANDLKLAQTQKESVNSKPIPHGSWVPVADWLPKDHDCFVNNSTGMLETLCIPHLR